MKHNANEHLTIEKDRELKAKQAYIYTMRMIDRNREWFDATSDIPQCGEIKEDARDGQPVQLAIIKEDLLHSFLDAQDFDCGIVIRLWERWGWTKRSKRGCSTCLINAWGAAERYIMLYILPDVIDAIKADQQAAGTPNVDASDISTYFDPKDPKTDQCVNNLLSALKSSEEADRARDFDFEIMKYLVVQAEQAAQRAYADDDITDTGEAKQHVVECMTLIRDVSRQIEKRFDEDKTKE